MIDDVLRLSSERSDVILSEVETSVETHLRGLDATLFSCAYADTDSVNYVLAAISGHGLGVDEYPEEGEPVAVVEMDFRSGAVNLYAGEGQGDLGYDIPSGELSTHDSISDAVDAAVEWLADKGNT